jgi:hypothetical protein
MATAARPQLTPGRVYRTRDLQRWSANAPRLAKRLVRDRALVPLGRGLFFHPKAGHFGRVPPSDEELLRGFLDGTPFVVTGPERWNALGLGTTAVFAAPLVYDHKRSGFFVLGGRPFDLHRRAFPKSPSPEWFVVDLFENADQAGASRAELTSALARALMRSAFDRQRLTEMAQRFGTKTTQRAIWEALSASPSRNTDAGVRPRHASRRNGCRDRPAPERQVRNAAENSGGEGGPAHRRSPEGGEAEERVEGVKAGAREGERRGGHSVEQRDFDAVRRREKAVWSVNTDRGHDHDREHQGRTDGAQKTQRHQEAAPDLTD